MLSYVFLTIGVLWIAWFFHIKIEEKRQGTMGDSRIPKYQVNKKVFIVILIITFSILFYSSCSVLIKFNSSTAEYYEEKE